MRSNISGEKMRQRIFLILGATVLTVALIVATRPLIMRWRADRTARRLVHVLHTRDSSAFASLSSRGSPRTFRCIQQLWPAEFWSLNGRAPKLMRIPAPSGEFGFRMVGEALRASGAPPVLDFFIMKGRPTKVERIFVDARLGVWTPAVYACLHPREA